MFHSPYEEEDKEMTNPQVPPEPKPPPPPVVQPTRPRTAEEASRPLPTSAVRFTRTAAAWWALIVGSLVLILLLIFIAQNLDSTPIHFFGWNWNAPVGIAFLVAAICGSLITVATGAARMVQLRRAAKKNLRHPGPPSQTR
jgi:uncharacterized integral membrane protein